MKTPIAIFFTILGLALASGSGASHGGTAAQSAQPPLELRTYKFDPLVFLPNLKKGQAVGTNHVAPSEDLRMFLESKGVHFGPSPSVGSPVNLFVNDRVGVIYVRTSSENHKKIEPLLAKLNQKQ